MIPIRDLFEAHLTVANLQRSMSFFGDALGLELAQVFRERKVAFYWIGRRGDSMIGLWEAGTGPQRMNQLRNPTSESSRGDKPFLQHGGDFKDSDPMR